MRLLILFIAASLAFAQDKPAEQEKPARQNAAPSVAEIIQVKTLTGDSFDRLLKLLSVFKDARIQGDSQLRTIVVYAPKDVVDQMRHIVEQLDRPGSEAAIGTNIDMTLTLLRCTATPAATPAPLPPSMDSVARQLKTATSCKDVELWDAVPLRIQEGKDTHEDLVMPGSPRPGQFTSGTIDVHPEAVYRKDQGRYVRFSKVDLTFRLPVGNGKDPGQFSWQFVSMKTSGEFMEGQKTVIGKVSGSAESESIFAVIELKVLN